MNAEVNGGGCKLVYILRKIRALPAYLTYLVPSLPKDDPEIAASVTVKQYSVACSPLKVPTVKENESNNGTCDIDIKLANRFTGVALSINHCRYCKFLHQIPSKQLLPSSESVDTDVVVLRIK